MLIVRTVSPNDYANLIHIHAARSTTSTLYPGPNYINLSTWLKTSERIKEQSLPEKKDRHCLAVFYDLAVHRNPGRTWYFSRNELDLCLEMHRPQKDSGQILLLRGCPSPDWIMAVGGKYRLDPEFIRRHLDFFIAMPARSAFSFPALASSSSNIVSLTTSTILYKDSFQRKKVDEHWKRRIETEEMTAYRRQYQVQHQCGDSIVREFSTLDDDYAVVEQNISICVQRCADGWIGTVHDLSSRSKC